MTEYHEFFCESFWSPNKVALPQNSRKQGSRSQAFVRVVNAVEELQSEE
jgi:hypothetical protein